MTESLLNLLTFSPTQPLLFNSGLFLFLFVAFCLGYALLSGKKNTALRLLYVTAFSYYFYYKSSGTYFFLLAIQTLKLELFLLIDLIFFLRIICNTSALQSILSGI